MKKIIKRSLFLIFLIALSVSLLSTSDALAEDWDQILEAAEEEGEVTIYATTSRVYDMAENFEEAYENISVDPHRLPEAELIERITAEVTAEVSGADVVIIEDLATMEIMLMEPGYLTNYVPPSAQEAVDEEYHDPLVLGFVNRIFGYNTEVHHEEPISNIWEFTDEEWAAGFQFRDPEITGEHLNFFSEIVRRSDEMEEKYEELYGEPLEIREDNAGLEFIRRLAANDPVILDSDTAIFENVGTRGQENPPLGFTYVFSKHREIEPLNLAVDYMRNIEPTLGYYYGMYVQQVDTADNPNAAKVLTDFMLSEEGFQPWAEDVGVYSMNENIDFHPLDRPWEYWQDRLWTYDPGFAAEQRSRITEAWRRGMED